MSRSFGQIVREARLGRHLSMGQLAAAVDRSTASVRRWERDDGLPTQDVIDTLVARLGLDPDEVDEALGEVRGESVETDDPRSVEEGDPIDVVPLADMSDVVGEPEQPLVSAAPVMTSAAAPPPPTAWPTASVPVAVVEQDQNILQIIRDPDRPWLGYIRAALTLIVLGGLVWVLTWAVPEFLDAFGEMWDSLWEQEGTQA